MRANPRGEVSAEFFIPEIAGRPLIVPGAADALAARLIEQLGFGAVYVSGAGVTNSYLGVPDLALMTLTELAAQVEAIRDVVELPILVDADTGFGGPLNVRRTVRMLERRGASAIQLEDQVSPKRCGHFAGTEVVPTAEMVAKLSAALDARNRESLLIVARTDARESLGLEVALERAEIYREAGADIIFIEAPQSLEEIREIGRRIEGPLLVNMVEGGLTPTLPADELGLLGYSVILYANTALRAAISGMRVVLERLLQQGSTLGVLDRIAEWNDRQVLVGKPLFDELSARYATPRVRDRG